MSNFQEKTKRLLNYLQKYNTYIVTVKDKTFLCLDLSYAGIITFKLGRFNMLCTYLNSENGYDFCDFEAEYKDNIVTVKCGKNTITVECINDPDHIINHKKFNGGWNLFKEEYTDFKRSYTQDGLYYCVIDLFKIGKLSDRDHRVFENIFTPYNQHAPLNIYDIRDRSGLTLTICYICNLETHTVDECVVWDIVNQRAVGKVMFG